MEVITWRWINQESGETLTATSEHHKSKQEAWKHIEENYDESYLKGFDQGELIGERVDAAKELAGNFWLRPEEYNKLHGGAKSDYRYLLAKVVELKREIETLEMQRRIYDYFDYETDKNYWADEFNDKNDDLVRAYSKLRMIIKLAVTRK